MERYIGYAYLVAALIGYVITARRSPGKAKGAGSAAWKSFSSIAPTFLAVFALVGLIDTFIPAELIERALGSGNHLLSLLLGGALGSLAAGPPAAAFPIASTLLAGGALPAAIAAFIVSWTLVGIVSLPFEARIFGMKFALWRNGLSFIFALLIGATMGGVL
jgi:uncharacterized membrane protein YraQ (UPF0718 family)